MKLLCTSMAAAAAAFLLTASLAGACGEKKTSGASGAAQLTSGGGCGSKAKAAKGGEAMLTSGGGCASKAKAAKGGEAQLTSGEGCAKGADCCKKGGAMKAGGGCADKAKMAGGGCCAKKGQPVMASISDATDESSCKFKAGTVDFKGTVLCKHCDLKQGETCATMFKTASGCLFTLSGEKASTLRQAAVGGGKLVRVKGEVSEGGELVVNTFRVLRSVDAGASAM